jgi:hypothetical protein
VGSGVDTRFWEDISLREVSLAYQYAILYNIVQRKEVCFPSVLSQIPLNISFRRSLVGTKWVAWLYLC